MPIEDVFSITGRGTVVTGRVEQGIVKVGDEVEIVGIKDTKKTVVTGVEMFRKLLDQGQAGDNIGALLRGVDKEDVERGQVLAKPGSITPHTKFKAQVYILTKDEGGRHTPFFNGYRPQFYFRTTDVTGVANLPEGTEMVMPGDNVEMTVELITPIAMDKELRFAIREGGRTVGVRRRRRDHRVTQGRVGPRRRVAQLVVHRTPNPGVGGSSPSAPASSGTSRTGRTTVEWNPAIWIRDGRQYLVDVRSEFRKLTWPTQREYVGGTIGVHRDRRDHRRGARVVIDVALAAAMQWILPRGAGGPMDEEVVHRPHLLGSRGQGEAGAARARPRARHRRSCSTRS